MMRTILTVLLGLAIAGCRPDRGSVESNQMLSPEQVAGEIAALRQLIIPPGGTSKADIDAVFGEPREIEEPNGKGQAGMYPMHIYQLLPPRAGHNFRAFLHITYRDGKAHSVGINHACVRKGMPQRRGDAERERHARENHLVLADLIEIKRKYEVKLMRAAWNRKAVSPAMELDGQKERN